MGKTNDMVVVGVGVVIENDQGLVLIGKRKGGHAPYFSIPGGLVEKGETFEQAAKREVLEEVGIEITNPTVISITNNVETFEDEGFHTISVILHADRFTGSPKVMEPEKCESWEWVDPSNLPEPHFEASTKGINCFMKSSFYTSDDTTRRIILVGDPGAGKSTFLNTLSEKYRAHHEKLAQSQKKEIYDDLVMKNIQYGLYFFDRDVPVWNKGGVSFYEYCPQATSAFIRAHEKVGAMTSDEVDTVERFLQTVSKHLPLHEDDVILHFMCDMETMQNRLGERAEHLKGKKEEYILVLRDELEKKFARQKNYIRIDTTNLTPEELKKEVKKSLPWIEYK